jgi:hypothetical protein
MPGCFETEVTALSFSLYLPRKNFIQYLSEIFVIDSVSAGLPHFEFLSWFLAWCFQTHDLSSIEK